ncbi:MAG TPA: alpha/beta fold hydrolase [Burkholderiales bacterium]|nr:alpha/beta fold hydrolase [Burkholderiales bacterium]
MLWTLFIGFAFAVAVQAQSGRTLEELKAETQARADRNAYPLIGLKPDEVREALGRLASMDRDEWAASWSQIGERYMAKKDFHQAWLYYSFARWPVPNSPGKQRAYDKALEAYWAYAKKYDPPLEILRVPYEGSEVVGYLRMPKNAKNVPFVIAIAGLDSRKEEMIERFGPLAERGIGVLALDSPGTGQSGVKAAPGVEKSLSQVMDVILARPQIDKKRVALYGGSFGGYWAAILAAAEKPRLRAVVAQSPPVHEYFSREHTQGLAKNREYLFDYVPAHMFTYGAASVEQLVQLKEPMSLETRGVLDQPMAPMLVIGGALDTQVPLADLELLMRTGESPKEIWLHPKGGHMGRDRANWPDPVIFKRVTTPWLLKALEVDAG